MSPTDFKKLQEKFSIGPGVTKINCPEAVNRFQPDAQIAVKSSGRSTDEDRLNKLERAYLGYLRYLGYDWIGIQCITLKLADDCRYTPDFWTMEAEPGVPMARGQLIARETKGGFFRDDAKVKIKVAARMFPFIVFVLIRRQKSGLWETEIVKP